MKKRTALLLFLFILFVSVSVLHAQSTSSSSSSMSSSQFDMTGFPQWAKDLRRAEIITFGSFPFAYFFTSFSFDTYRFATNGWDRRYAPWPIKSAGAIESSQNEKLMTIGIAAGVAVLIAVIDYGIVRHKRNRLEQESRNLPPGTPIIIRSPMNGETDESPESMEIPAPSAPGSP